MDYSEDSSNSDGQQPHQNHNEDQEEGFILPSEPRQQQQHIPAQQQQQQPSWVAQRQQSLYTQQQHTQPPTYSRQIYPQQSQDSMTAPPVAMTEHSPGGYLAHRAVPVQRQPPPIQQQYMYPDYHGASPGYSRQYSQQMNYQQHLAMQQSMPMVAHPPQQPLLHHSMDQTHAPIPLQQPLHQSYLQPKIGRLPADRPLIKLSISLIDTYKHINTVYYEEREARKAARAKEKQKKGEGAINNGWDDENYDYVISPGELILGRYRIKERIGKGSFGQVVRAEDVEEQRDVAIKIIKSKKPFLMQAKTEIELLSHLNDRDINDENNIGKYNKH
jgi:hypothetical protein